MKKVKYYYNTQNLRYEKLNISTGNKVWRVMGYVVAVVVTGFVIALVLDEYVDSPAKKQLKRELSMMQLQYELINQKMGQMDQVLGDLQERDDNIYRVIFEADPIPNSVREGYYGGVNRYKDLENYSNSELMLSTVLQMEKIRKKFYIQSKSYDEVLEMARNKEEMLAAIPAIQPISNKDLKRMASGYGYRIDPVYKTRAFHSGMDFTAPRGTEIYATGDGVVIATKRSRTLGIYVKVDHGYGYQTLYAHMNKKIAKPGTKIRRGEVIGYVGNTGKSVGPHLHYEVHKDGIKLNPVRYFYNDLNAEEYEEMLDLASRQNQSLD